MEDWLELDYEPFRDGRSPCCSNVAILHVISYDFRFAMRQRTKLSKIAQCDFGRVTPIHEDHVALDFGVQGCKPRDC